MLSWTPSPRRTGPTALWQRLCKFLSVVGQGHPCHPNDACRCRSRLRRIVLNWRATGRFLRSPGNTDDRNEDAGDLAGNLPRAAARHYAPDPQRPVGRIPLRPITVPEFKVAPPVWTECRSCQSDRDSRCRQHAPNPVSITPAHAGHGPAYRHDRLTGNAQISRMPDCRTTAAHQREANATANTMSWAIRQGPPRAREAKETTTPGRPPADAGYGGFRANAAASDADAPGSPSCSDRRPRRFHPRTYLACGRHFPASRGVS